MSAPGGGAGAPRKRVRKPNGTGDPNLLELIEAVLDMTTAIDMTNALLDGSVQSATNLKLDELIRYVKVTATPGVGGATQYNPTGARFIAPPNQSQRPGAWGGGGAHDVVYPGGHSWVRNNVASLIDQRYGSPGGSTYEELPHPAPNGEKQYRVRDGAGNVSVQTASQAAPGIADANRRARVSGYVGAYQSGGVLGALGKLPVVGGVVRTVEGLANTGFGIGSVITGQRASDAPYQSIYGGTNIEGLKQRGYQLAYSVGQQFSGGFTTQQANSLFQGVSSLGYQGNDRQARLDFAQGNYKSLGIDPSESLKYIALAAQNTALDLNTLRDSLKNVSEIAVTTSQSAQVLRESFYKNLSADLSTGYGSAATTLAQSQTAVTAGLGRQFTGIGFDVSPNAEYIRSATAGYSNPLSYELANQKSNGQLEANTIDTIASQSLQNAAPELYAWVQAEVKKRKRKPTDYNDALTWLDSAPANVVNATQPQAVFNALTYAGYTGIPAVTNPGLIAYAILIMAGTASLAVQNAAQNAKNDVKVKSVKDRTTRSLGGFKSVYDSKTNSIKTVEIPQTTIAKPKAGVYDSKVETDPTIAKLEKAIGKNGTVRVQTKDGPRTITLAEAEAGYADQLADGSAIIESGGADYEGSTIGNKFGYERNAHKVYGTSTRKAAPKDEYHFKGSQYENLTAAQRSAFLSWDRGSGQLEKSVAKSFYEKQLQGYLLHPDTIPGVKKATSATNKVSNGTVTIDLKSDVKKYLQVALSGNSLVESGAAANVPPSLQSQYGGN